MKGLDYMEQNKKPIIIAIANEKGGVAKTTSAINIGAGFASKGKKCLLIDLDSQTHLSDWLEFEFDGKPTISEFIYQTVANFVINPSDFVRHNKKLNLDYIPATQMCSGVVTTLGVDSDSTTVLKRMLSDGFFNRYDYIIIDCCPSLDLRVTNAIVCADKLLIPVQTDPMAYKGTDKMLNTFLRIKPNTDINTNVLILPTMFHTTIISNTVYEALIKSYGNMVLPPIPYRTSAVNTSATKSILIRRQSDDIGKAYMKVVNCFMGGEKND